MRKTTWAGFGCVIMPVLLGLAMAGCQSAQMAIPPELESRAEVMPCTDRGGFSFSEAFSFGAYHVSQVKRGWTKRVTWGIVFYERSNSRQQFEFQMATPEGVPWLGQASTGVTQSDLKGNAARGQLTWNLSSDLNFVVQLAPTGQSNAWSLVMAEKTKELVMNGQLSNGRTTFRVEGSRDLAGTTMPLMDTAGYLFYKGGKLAGAVDVLNDGAVQLDRQLPATERDALAAAATALLLYRDISAR